jgi:hypothetical protein
MRTGDCLIITLLTRPPAEDETAAAPAPLHVIRDCEIYASLRPEFKALVHTAWGYEATESETLVLLFHDIMESDVFRTARLPDDMYCLAPGCGRKQVVRGATLGSLTDYDVAGAPAGCSPFIWKFHTAIGGGLPPLPRVFLGATCPRSKRCTVRAMVSLDAWLLARPGEFGRQWQRDKICGACYANIEASPLGCTDECGTIYYCSAKCRDAHREAHEKQRATDTEVMAKQRVCSCCGRVDYALRKCSRCRLTYYCDAKCQAMHWTHGGHKAVCEAPKTRDSSE